MHLQCLSVAKVEFLRCFSRKLGACQKWMPRTVDGWRRPFLSKICAWWIGLTLRPVVADRRVGRMHSWGLSTVFHRVHAHPVIAGFLKSAADPEPHWNMGMHPRFHTGGHVGALAESVAECTGANSARRCCCRKSRAEVVSGFSGVHAGVQRESHGAENLPTTLCILSRNAG